MAYDLPCPQLLLFLILDALFLNAEFQPLFNEKNSYHLSKKVQMITGLQSIK